MMQGNAKCVVRHISFEQLPLPLLGWYWGESIMLARSASKVYDRVGPQTFLLVGLILTVGWIGLLGYGFLALMGY